MAQVVQVVQAECGEVFERSGRGAHFPAILTQESGGSPMTITSQHDLSPLGREAQPRKATHMHKHSRSTVLGLAVLGLALIAAPAFAANLFTVNTTEHKGAAG